MSAPNLPDDLTPLELARRVFDAWRAASPEPRAELPAPLVQIARALLVCVDADRIAAALDVPRHVLLDADAASGAPATTSTTSFVALPATGTSDASVVEPPGELVVECPDGTVIRARGPVHVPTIGALVRELRTAAEPRP